MAAATPFTKILVANRGEIALRVMRSARALGYRTVAVYSSADAGARHVLEADQAVCIGAPEPRHSYLNIPALIDAARRSGADAVHPGYGFLAENAVFAQACRDAGLVFIGPSPAAITAMGDKAGAKALMAAAGVPVIPGYQGPAQSAERLASEARQLGWPVMIKATAGGGGRGMRRVHRAEDFAASLQSAQSEALGAFGDATVILERALIAPRHIEIQVFADRHGNAVHLGERDCSVQRRHQKLIEEAPSPAVDADLRARMGAVAVKAVQAIGYEGAGTLEFLLDAQGNFFFMEMNTRLQVEHPVTEAITGLDLVGWQLRVAAGEPLPLAQHALCFSGHAIEVRLCAEDPVAGFLPQSGRMVAWAMPDGPGALRVEHALRPGDEIPPYYDSMIAKLVAHGANRAEALRKLQHGLHDAVALGLATNQAFLSQCLAHPVFGQGEATTAFIEEHGPELLAPLQPGGNLPLARRAAALAALLLHHSGGPGTGATTLAHRMPMQQHFALDGVRCQGQLQQLQPGHYLARLQLQEARPMGEPPPELALQILDQRPGSTWVMLDGLAEPALWRRDADTLHLHFAGRPWTVRDLSQAAAMRAGDGTSDGKLRASMNGRVVALLAGVGDSVAAGQPLFTLEAMKMEHVHAAPCAGRLAALHVSLGEQVAAARLVAEVTPAPAPAAA